MNGNQSLQSNEFVNISAFFLKRCGLVLPRDKEYLIIQRLSPMLRDHNVPTWEDLVEILQSGTNDLFVDEAVHRITTHETSFFRDKHPFQSLHDELFPRFAEIIRHRKSRPIQRRGPVFRFWNAAVSTGQECYSLAITLDRFMSSSHAHGVSYEDFSITATDISSTVLSQAMSGAYSEAEVSRGVDPETKQKYFQMVDGQWRVIDRLRSIMQFQTGSLIEPFKNLGAFDMIWCRNVLIYFDEPQRRAIFDRFVEMMDLGGVLLLGASESIIPAHPHLTPVRHGPTTWYECVK